MALGPYATVNQHEMFRLPSGEIGGMADQVDARYFPHRFVEEVMLLQECLGVEPDGIIGPKTRAAARAVYEARRGG
jgi:murein L,D-transpeptidase YcbB/YkuD